VASARMQKTRFFPKRVFCCAQQGPLQRMPVFPVLHRHNQPIIGITATAVRRSLTLSGCSSFPVGEVAQKTAIPCDLCDLHTNAFSCRKIPENEIKSAHSAAFLMRESGKKQRHATPLLRSGPFYRLGLPGALLPPRLLRSSMRRRILSSSQPVRRARFSASLSQRSTRLLRYAVAALHFISPLNG
jgi:hypothetical protein